MSQPAMLPAQVTSDKIDTCSPLPQVLLYNTRNFNKLKDRYMQTFKLDSTDMSSVAKRLRDQISKEIQDPTVVSRPNLEQPSLARPIPPPFFLHVRTPTRQP
jgi:hypothetical protein